MEKISPTWKSVRNHKLPEWYEKANLGIFIHWGLYSVPAYAPDAGELGTIPDDEWFTNNPYAEWYFNSIGLKNGPSYEHHKKTYGADFAYEDFKNMWNAEYWNPYEWADIFKEAEAKYVIITAKHHDGFCLFPSKYTSYNSMNFGPKRDIVGELCEAVRSRRMKFGCYYSGLIDWTYYYQPIYDDNDLRQCECPTYEYADYAYKQCIELIDRYHIDVLWNDIGWPKAGEQMLPSLFSYYYNTCPEGVVNDRFNGLHSDFWCREYQSGTGNINDKWELCRGIGHSFGYNAYENKSNMLSSEKLIALYNSTISNNGNLLINLGPRSDGIIPEEQKIPLLEMGKWIRKKNISF